MKIVLQNGEEMTVTRINKNISAGGSDQVMITFGRNADIEAIKEKLTAENASPVVLRREGYKDKTYEGYAFQSVTEDVSEESTNITAVLVKQD